MSRTTEDGERFQRERDVVGGGERERGLGWREGDAVGEERERERRVLEGGGCHGGRERERDLF